MGFPWEYSVGDYGLRVTVYRRRHDGPVYLYAQGRRERRGFMSDADAETLAHQVHVEIRRGLARWKDGSATLGLVFEAYRKQKLPHMSVGFGKAALRRMGLFEAAFGRTVHPEAITLRDWEQFIRDRSAGRYGRGPVRPRTVQADLLWLLSALTWATRWRMADGRYLLAENPCRGLPVPEDRNPRRNAAEPGRYAAVMAVADKYGYLAEILPLVRGSGRRLSAVLALRYADLRPDGGPYGSIVWREESDKARWASVTPVRPEVRAVLDGIVRDRPGIGDARLFPGLRARSRPTHRSVADSWLRRAEAECGLEPLPGAMWHAYKRRFVTELGQRGVPLPVVGKLTGNSHLQNLSKYFQPDADALYEALTGPVDHEREGRKA